MTSTSSGFDRPVILDTNVEEFFQQQIMIAAEHQGLAAREDTVHYVVKLLTAFVHARTLYEDTPDGPMIKPLALLYADAVSAPHPNVRNQALKRLGDVALFIAGVFPDSLNRQLVDVDYYIAMGGNAYSYLSDTSGNTLRWQSYRPIFDELARKFTAFVDLLGEVTEQCHFSEEGDVLRLYEVWLRTGSERSAQRLRKLGIQPPHASVSHRQH